MHYNDWRRYVGANAVTKGPHDREPALAPGGERVVFSRREGPGTRQLFIKNLRSGVLKQFTYTPPGVVNTEPEWSPDGSDIAFARKVGTDWDLYLKLAGSGALVQLTSGDANDTNPSWSPDGTQIAFSSDRNGGGLYLLDVIYGSVSLAYPAPVIACSWSPDGKYIVASVEDADSLAAELSVIDLATGSATTIQGEGDLSDPAWRPISK